MARCRKRGHGSGWIRRSKRLRIYARDQFVCVYCNKQALSHDLTLDHVKPRSNGGHNAPSNLVTACRRCNSAKQDLNLRAWCLKLWRLTLHVTGSYQEADKVCYTAVRRRIRNATRRKLP